MHSERDVIVGYFLIERLLSGPGGEPILHQFNNTRLPQRAMSRDIAKCHFCFETWLAPNIAFDAESRDLWLLNLDAVQRNLQLTHCLL